MQNENLNFEIRRKIFHLYGLIFPLVYSFIPKTSMNVLLLILTGFTLYADISRNHNQKIKEVVDKFFSNTLQNVGHWMSQEQWSGAGVPAPIRKVLIATAAH